MKLPSLVLGAVLAATTAQAQGSMRGCVVDRTGAVLPGVRITLAGRNGTQTAVANGQGCYEVRNVTAGRYSLQAELPGFKTVNREGIRVTEGQTVIVHLKMSLDKRLRVEVGRFIEWCRLPGGLAGLWGASDAVARVRVNRNRVVARDLVVEHTATVTELFKRPAHLSQTRTTVVFRQEQFTSEGTYKVGQDLVIFLRLREGKFYRVSGWFGAFLVDGDRIQSVNPEAAPEGTSVDDFVAKLRALAKEGRQ